MNNPVKNSKMMPTPEDYAEIKTYISDHVRWYPGAYATNLIVKACNKFSHLKIDAMDILSTMVKDGDLIELEYVKPEMDYQTKSLYFIADTKLKIREFPHK